ncbi:tetratricopeptide repeat protein [Bradyrhizobium sp. WYCCWR 13023]|uniref:Tetratricopeptide repeat protein n=1 Tax=Bradyrhizobium zhengyangense TaxID=2911009 RepID=A0A9X1UIP8_9BRAD|nr:tetratricopeptide repeat-containing glycosyltransferase family protein [Bradyrhizobium zhengyangense]MCG2630152.1 tetratricopeptide repeat protein [Bradyrhizobium zhengyangense]
MNRRERRATAAKHSGKVTPAALCEAGFAHLQSGCIAEAELSCQQALTLDEQHPDALHLLGALCFHAQQPDAAVEWIGRAVQQAPKAEYLLSLATVLERQGRLEDARQHFSKASSLKPDDASLWNHIGNLLWQLGHKDEAAKHLQQALKLNPNYWEAAHNGGMLLLELGRHAEAVECFDVTEKLNRTSAALHQMRAVCLSALNRFDEAEADYEKSIALDPNLAETHNNLGLLHWRFGRLEQAFACFDRALALRPDSHAVLNNKAVVLLHLQMLDEAFATLHRSLAAAPDDAQTLFYLATLQLLTGDFERGWPAREARWRLPSVGLVDRGFSKPLWRGERPLEGKTILLHSDEGLGDAIQFARYVPMVAASGARVILEVEPPIQQLLGGIEGVAECVGRSSTPAFDLHCPLGTLPLAFGTRFDTIPLAQGYIPAPPAARVKAWQDRLGPHDRFRVGLVWTGNPDHKNDHNRSMALRTLAPLLDCDVQFVSLQKGVRDQDRAFLAERRDIVDLTEQLTDFSETAALISCLDLVISVDTSVAHLAGALRAPVWTLVPFNPDWRWLLERDDSPWYQSMRLFRQTQRGDWTGVVENVRDELEGRVSAWRSKQDQALLLPV